MVQLLSGGNPVARLYSANTTGDPTGLAVPAVSPPFPGGLSSGVTLSPTTESLDGFQTGAIDGETYGPTTPFGAPAGPTGWVTSSFLPAAGTYQLRFFVSDVLDADINSALAIDNIRVTAVPEPTTLTLLGIGLAGLIVGYRRRKK
jgi:hypothetical protein